MAPLPRHQRIKGKSPTNWPRRHRIQKFVFSESEKSAKMVRAFAANPALQRSCLARSFSSARAVRAARPAVRVAAGEAADIEVPSLDMVDNARSAIAVGLRLTEAGRWEEAETYFQRALELPGTGIKRFRDKPPTLSDGEKISVM